MNKKNMNTILALLLLFITPLAVFGADEKEKNLEEKIQELELKLKTMEDTLKAQTADPNTKQASVENQEVHGQVQLRGLDLSGLYARADIDDAAILNRVLELEGAESVRDVLQGGYLQVGYNVLSQVTDKLRLTPYYRFEKLNTQSSVPAGYVKDPAKARKIHTAGLEFRPITNIAVKGDYQWNRDQDGTGVNQFNVNLGYNF